MNATEKFWKSISTHAHAHARKIRLREAPHRSFLIVTIDAGTDRLKIYGNAAESVDALINLWHRLTREIMDL